MNARFRLAKIPCKNTIAGSRRHQTPPFSQCEQINPIGIVKINPQTLIELIPMQEIPPIVKANGMSGVSKGLNCPSATNAKAVPRQIDSQMPA